jgi:hypothetical protein
VRIAFYVENGVEQIIFTPEDNHERSMLGKLHDGTREMQVFRGGFYWCRGGWGRWRKPFVEGPYGAEPPQDESTIIVLKPAVAEAKE